MARRKKLEARPRAARARPSGPAAVPPPGRRVYCNRTLNLRAIRAIGFDMDYTLIHYHPEAWERRAYEQLGRRLAGLGFPVADLEFDPEAVCPGLVVDLELGNLVKANRFGYVHQAEHGGQRLDPEARRRIYGRELIDLAEPRWVFLNTLFSLSEACMYAQLVARLDQGRLPGPLGYADLWAVIRANLDAAHTEGELKAEIMAAPGRFVVPDEELPLALRDLKAAGKKLLLITNSEWDYTRAMLSHVLDPRLPRGQTWEDLFDLKIVQARKPEFFTMRHPMFEVVDGEGRLRPLRGALREGGTYLGGHAGLVEQHLGLDGEEILYVGDHVFADVRASKRLLRWRTALVMRQLEDEVTALQGFAERQARLDAWMAEKGSLEAGQAMLRLELQRLEAGYGPPAGRPRSELLSALQATRAAIEALDEQIGPVAREYGELSHPRWGLLMRAGGEKSHLAWQIERFADVYTSRPSNFLWQTPFGYLRAPHGGLPHDSAPAAGAEGA